MRKTVLITGARGTVGHYVVGLAEAAGYRVIVSDVSKKGLRVPVHGEVRPGDLRDPETPALLVRGVDAVIHTAGQMSAFASAAELSKVNTVAVERLYQAGREAGVTRFLHVSTAMLYRSTGSAPITEDTELSPRGPHGLSKLGAEVFLRSQVGGPAWTILRAAPVYGRRGKHFAASLLAIAPMLRMAAPILPRPHGGPLGTMVHAEDVARALLFLLPREAAHQEVFNVSDGDPMTLGARLAETFSAYGLRTLPTGRFPEAGLRMVGRGFQKMGLYRGADVAALSAWRAVVLRHGLKEALRPRFDREALTLLYEDLVVSNTKLGDLGFQPRFDRFSTGFREVLRWYQAEGWVPRYG